MRMSKRNGDGIDNQETTKVPRVLSTTRTASVTPKLFTVGRRADNETSSLFGIIQGNARCNALPFINGHAPFVRRFGMPRRQFFRKRRRWPWPRTEKKMGSMWRRRKRGQQLHRIRVVPSPFPMQRNALKNYRRMNDRTAAVTTRTTGRTAAATQRVEDRLTRGS